MPWGRLDDSFYDHPKLDALPDGERLAGAGLWAIAISWCNRFLTDGHVPRGRIVKLGGTIDLAEHLVAAGLFEHDGTGYAVHDFLEFNDSRAEVEERRAKDATRKAEYRAHRRGAASPNGTTSVSDADVPGGVPQGVPGGVRAESRKVSQGSTRARDVARVPTRPDPSQVDTPIPPQAGADDGSTKKRGSRANGTSPRQIAQAEQEAKAGAEAAVRWRRAQRQLAYARGAITEAQQRAMDAADEPLEVIPGWAEHRAGLAAERDAPSPLEDVTRWQ